MGAPHPVFPRGAALWAFLLASLGSVAGQPLGAEPMCTAQPLARYSITFTGKWSQASFPKQYPLFRPPAQWSSLLGERSPGPVPGAPRGDRRAGYSAEAPHFTVRTAPSPLTSVQEIFAKVFCAPAAVPSLQGHGGAGLHSKVPGWRARWCPWGGAHSLGQVVPPQGAGFRVQIVSLGCCSLVWARGTPREPGWGDRRCP